MFALQTTAWPWTVLPVAPAGLQVAPMTGAAGAVELGGFDVDEGGLDVEDGGLDVLAGWLDVAADGVGVGVGVGVALTDGVGCAATGAAMAGGATVTTVIDEGESASGCSADVRPAPLDAADTTVACTPPLGLRA